MARGGKRVGAGAPKGNRNALKHGGRAKVHYGVPLDKTLSSFEYCCASMKPDTNLGGIITTQTEVFYDKTTSLFFSRV